MPYQRPPLCLVLLGPDEVQVALKSKNLGKLSFKRVLNVTCSAEAGTALLQPDSSKTEYFCFHHVYKRD